MCSRHHEGRYIRGTRTYLSSSRYRVNRASRGWHDQSIDHTDPADCLSPDRSRRSTISPVRSFYRRGPTPMYESNLEVQSYYTLRLSVSLYLCSCIYALAVADRAKQMSLDNYTSCLYLTEPKLIRIYRLCISSIPDVYNEWRGRGWSHLRGTWERSDRGGPFQKRLFLRRVAGNTRPYRVHIFIYLFIYILFFIHY